VSGIPPRPLRTSGAGEIREVAELYVEGLIDAGDTIPDNPQDGMIVISAPAVVVSRSKDARSSVTAREFVVALTRDGFVLPRTAEAIAYTETQTGAGLWSPTTILVNIPGRDASSDGCGCF
jgi:hypothetical protein